MRKYVLYEVRIIGDIPMLTWIGMNSSANIIEAEELFSGSMMSGEKYMILIEP